MVYHGLYDSIYNYESAIMKQCLAIMLIEWLIGLGTRRGMKGEHYKAREKGTQHMLSLYPTPCSRSLPFWSSLWFFVVIASHSRHTKSKANPGSPSYGRKLTLHQRVVHAYNAYHASTSTETHQAISQILHNSQQDVSKVGDVELMQD